MNSPRARVSDDYLLHAALITGNAVANRHESGRNVSDPRWVHTLGVQPPSIGRIRRVFDAAPAGLRQRIARTLAASLVAVADRPGEILGEGTHTAAELRAKQLLNSADHASFDKAPEGTCRYCRLFESVIYGPGKVLPVKAVNHGRINPTFDPDTNVASAEITDLLLLVQGEELATRYLELAIPTSWKHAAPELFLRSDPVPPAAQAGGPTALLEATNAGPNGKLANGIAANGKHANGKHPNGKHTNGLAANAISPDLSLFRQWVDGSLFDPAAGSQPSKAQTISAPRQLLMFEEVSWPWSEFMSGRIENIIGFADVAENLSPGSGEVKSLSYTYFLESCLRSNMGLAWEEGGLDIDDGYYEGHAVSLNNTKRLEEVIGNSLLNELSDLPPGADIALKVKALRRYQETQLKGWDLDNTFLVKVAAKKSIRFTVPENTPRELWTIMTWTTPAILLVFLQQMLTQALHVVAAELIAKPSVRGQARGLTLKTSEHWRTYVNALPKETWESNRPT